MIDLILLSIIILGILVVAIVGSVGRYKKKKYLPIKSVNMSDKQRSYVLKRLSFQSSVCNTAKMFMVTIDKNCLKEKDLENLNKYLDESGIYIWNFKVY